MNRLVRTVGLMVVTLCAQSCAVTPAEPVVVFEPDPTLAFDRCIPVSRVADTDVLDDQNILFRMRGRELYRNFLPRRCPGLSSRDAFSYESRTGSLCRGDLIEVLEIGGIGPRVGAPCQLGGFYPVTAEEADALKAEIERVRELGLN
ncbi:MAG: hypothetical protein AAF417_00870 [Pseudomonadota bacterium]